ncbi:MAG TPA: hypothetical protein VFX89_15580 [Gammaproteobacteria bacterium]|nr:hypothetical protein [Gammaproteobacteria bacterium]
MRNVGTAFLTALLAAVALAAPPSGAQETATKPGARAARVGGEPNLNGVWQAMNTANWNLEAHSAEEIKPFWQLGSLAAIPAGQSVVTSPENGKIPYLPEALAKRAQNRKGWPEADPETKCYLPGIPRATYMPFPFQIVQGGDGTDILFAYEYTTANRVVFMSNHQDPPVDTWMGWSNGHWEDNTLVIETTGFNDSTWLDRAGNYHSSALKVTERLTLMDPDHIQYEATLEDENVYSEPWTISMPLYRHVEPNAEILEFKCVPFVEDLLYHDLELSE